MSLHFILDGYNIIHSIPQFALKDQIGALEALVQFVAVNRPQGSQSNSVRIIFDGTPKQLRHIPGGKIAIEFAAGSTADELIKQAVIAADNPRVLVVVSDDREVQRSARDNGARVMAVETFVNKGMRTKSPRAPAKQEIDLPQAAQITSELRRIWLRE